MDILKTIPVLCIILSMRCCSAANIIGFFAMPSYSHQQPLMTLSRALALKGHNVTVFITDPSKVPTKNLREISVRDLYAVFEELDDVSLQERQSGPFKIVSIYPKMCYELTRRFLEKDTVKKFLREVKETGTKFDLVLYDELCSPSPLGMFYEGGKSSPPPSISIRVVGGFLMTDFHSGNPMNPSYITDILARSSDRMTFYERIENLLIKLYLFYTFKVHVYPSQQELMYKHFGKDVPYVEDIQRNTSLAIITSDLATSYPRPLQPNTIVVGPLHLKTPEALPQDLQKWMDGAEDGIIYFSLGSNMNGTSVSAETRALFIKAFSKFPKVRILWKWESDSPLPGKPSNVMVRKWFPQKSVLAHPKMKLFISQAGLQSSQESIYFGVPVLAMPCFYDQDYNTAKWVKEGAGLKLELADISYEMIYNNLLEMLTNPSYKENTLRLRKISLDKQSPAVDTAVWWVEYVLRHEGAHHLRPVALDLAWYQLYMIDILSLFVAITFFVSYICVCIFKLVASCFRKSGKKVKKS